MSDTIAHPQWVGIYNLDGDIRIYDTAYTKEQCSDLFKRLADLVGVKASPRIRLAADVFRGKTG